MSLVVASGKDQYGPYRCGPTYPLLFDQTTEELDIPSVDWARHPNGQIWFPVYCEDVWSDPKSPIMRYRRLCAVIELFEKGLGLLEEAKKKLGADYGSEISKQIALVRFMYCTYRTTSNVILWQIAKKLLITIKEKKEQDNMEILFDAIGVKEKTMEELASFMKQIAENETKNTYEANGEPMQNTEKPKKAEQEVNKGPIVEEKPSVLENVVSTVVAPVVGIVDKVSEKEKELSIPEPAVKEETKQVEDIHISLVLSFNRSSTLAGDVT